MEQRFGGAWTEEKLERLSAYLRAYMRIMKGNERARHFTTWYVDAFAGSGTREQVESSADSKDAEDAISFLEGSVKRALQTDPPFDRYVFVEKDPSLARTLDGVVSGHADTRGRTEVVVDDANAYLPAFCRDTDWGRNRAVVFLDPFGMQVDWSTTEAIAETQGIDLWILFPLGQAVNRLLTRKEPPPESWANKLTRVFGTDEWKDRFYAPPKQGRLFSDGFELEKHATLDDIGDFYLERLGTIFQEVARALPLRNSRGVPLFLLCFAASNPKGSKTAVRIANHLLKEKYDG